jgi:hypothetical protein
MLLAHSGKQLSFGLLSLADLTMTWALMRDGLGSVYESNPVAAWCLHGHGWAGMVIFKALMVLASGGLSEIISRYRPRTGGRVLTLGCVITAAVVLYSSYLYLTVPSSEYPGAESVAHKPSEQLQQEYARVNEFLRLQDKLADKLAQGRGTLSEVVTELETAAAAQYTWLRALRHANPHRSDRECLAIVLLRQCVAKHRSDPQAGRSSPSD